MAASAASISAGRGQVGGPPTVRLGPPAEGKRTTPALVIGRGKTFDGLVELVAYGWLAPRDTVGSASRKQFCVWVEYPPDEISPGTCGGPLDPGYQGAVAIDDRIRSFGPPGSRHTEIGGRLSPEVASVRVSYRRGGSARTVRVAAVVAQVGGPLQAKLKQPLPFGYFDAKLRGTVPLATIGVEAFDASGQLIGSAGRG